MGALGPNRLLVAPLVVRARAPHPERSLHRRDAFLTGRVRRRTDARSSIHTLIHVIARGAEAFFHYGRMEPATLRIRFVAGVHEAASAGSGTVLGHLERLTALRGKGTISDSEFERLKGIIHLQVTSC
jgi:hypothetical protein